MSTNFYMVPKKHKGLQEKLYAIQDEYNEKLKSLVEEYRSKVKEEIDFLTKDKNLQNIISYDDSETFLDTMNMPYLWEYELPTLHIGKRSGGWKFVFQTSKYWNNFDELKKFYNDNKDKLEIQDEYGKTYTLKKFIEKEVQPTYLKDGNISHIEYAKDHDHWGLCSYHLDEKYGYEFDEREFS